MIAGAQSELSREKTTEQQFLSPVQAAIAPDRECARNSMTCSEGSPEAQARAPSRWAKLPITLWAIISGLLIAMPAANVWPLLLRKLGVPVAATAEAIFLALYLWWASGGGPPQTTQAARATAFRRGKLSRAQMLWGVIAAIFFAATIHASIVLLFRLVPYPTAAFRHGYDLSFIPRLPLKWLAVVVSAASAGICEEAGFRGYMQRPIEQRHGAPVAILISRFSSPRCISRKTGRRQGWSRSYLARAYCWVLSPGRPDRSFLHTRSHADGHWTVRLLVDWHRWRLHSAADRYYGSRSAILHRVRRFHDLTFYGVFRDIGAPTRPSPHILNQAHPPPSLSRGDKRRLL